MKHLHVIVQFEPRWFVSMFHTTEETKISHSRLLQKFDRIRLVCPTSASASFDHEDGVSLGLNLGTLMALPSVLCLAISFAKRSALSASRV